MKGEKKSFIYCRGKCIADRFVLLYSNIKHNQMCFFFHQSSERVQEKDRSAFGGRWLEREVARVVWVEGHATGFCLYRRRIFRGRFKHYRFSKVETAVPLILVPVVMIVDVCEREWKTEAKEKKANNL